MPVSSYTAGVFACVACVGAPGSENSEIVGSSLRSWASLRQESGQT